MKRIGLLVHGSRKDAVKSAGQAVAFLTAAGVAVYAEEDAAQRLSGAVTPFSRMTQPPDAVLTLGGDGTLLRGAQYACRWRAPLLGINLGHLGFLAEAEPDTLQNALARLLAGDYTLEERSMLTVTGPTGQRLSLNDVVISRGDCARLITVETLVDGESSGRCVADGLIVATPTGSTGYSLSAGGPIIAPGVDCMVITPICAHSLQHRPVVVPGNAHVRLLMQDGGDGRATLQVDGQSCGTVCGGEAVDIARAAFGVRLIRLKPPQFFRLVRDKLTEWSR